MKYLLASLALLSVACGGAAQGNRPLSPAEAKGPIAVKNKISFDTLAPLAEEGPLADRPARMLKAMQAKGFAVALQKDKSVLLTTEKFGVVIPTNTAHVCQFDLPFLSGKGATNEASLIATLTKVDTYFWGTNFTFAPEASKFRVTARKASVVRNEEECAQIASLVLYTLTDTVETLGDSYGSPVFAGGAAVVSEPTNGSAIQLGNSAAGMKQPQDTSPQGYLDYYYGMLDAEGMDPHVDQDGDIGFTYEGAGQYLEMPPKINQFRQFSVSSIVGTDANETSLEVLRAGCMEAMKGSVFLSCVAYKHEQRVRWAFNTSAQVGRETDPRYNFRNMAAAVHQGEQRVNKYLAAHH